MSEEPPFGYDDPDPPKWPNNRTPSNRWYSGLHAFIYALKHRFSPYTNPLGMRAKYINVRIDTRNGNFLVFTDDQSGNCTRQTSPDELGIEFEPVSIYQPPKSDFNKEPPDYSKCPKPEYVPPKADSFDHASHLTTEDLMRILAKRADAPTNVKEIISLQHLRNK